MEINLDPAGRVGKAKGGQVFVRVTGRKDSVKRKIQKNSNPFGLRYNLGIAESLENADVFVKREAGFPEFSIFGGR